MRRDEKTIIEQKLSLWERQEFLLFIEDLSSHVGEIIDLKGDVDSLKRIYTAKLKDIVEKQSKLKQP